MSTYVGMRFAPVVAAPKQPERDATQDGAPDYGSMSKSDLAALCKGRGIRVSSRMNKTQLIELLEV